MSFEVKNKYTVLSLSDIQYLPQEYKDQLEDICTALQVIRLSRGKKPIDSMVVDKNTLGDKAYARALEVVEKAVQAKCECAVTTVKSGIFCTPVEVCVECGKEQLK